MLRGAVGSQPVRVTETRWPLAALMRFGGASGPAPPPIEAPARARE
jgi:hypothetical protein